jgi:hypothetical protein
MSVTPLAWELTIGLIVVLLPFGIVGSLIVIVAILVVTIYASLRSPAGKAKTEVAGRERIYAGVVAAERRLANMVPRFEQLIQQPQQRGRAG